MAAYDTASFRDPAGRVFHDCGRIFRILPEENAGFEQLRASGILDREVRAGRLWPTRVPDQASLPDGVRGQLGNGACALEHDVLPFVSYPYEWPFSLLKRAALFHLDLQMDLLLQGFHFSDGSAFNVQFIGTRPTFIDTLSIQPYAEGQYWSGYRQFCEQFLNPLALSAMLGVPFQAWYRGAVHGIPVEQAAKLLPWREKLRLGNFMHIVLHGRLAGPSGEGQKKNIAGARPLSRSGLELLLKGLRATIARLQGPNPAQTVWGDYAGNNSYRQGESAAKAAFVADFCSNLRPGTLWDIGCNTGDFSEVALRSGAGKVVGFDSDIGALETAIVRADAGKLDFLPLCMDITNPSPSQGWRQDERKGLGQRAGADAILALALLHHMVIGSNIPLHDAVARLADLAPTGIIEFVPRHDPMVQRMLTGRANMFSDYSLQTFREALLSRTRILKEQEITADGRTLFLYGSAS